MYGVLVWGIGILVICVIKNLICGNNQSWLLNFNLTYETLQTSAGNALLTSTLFVELFPLLIIRLPMMTYTRIIDWKIMRVILKFKYKKLKRSIQINRKVLLKYSLELSQLKFSGALFIRESMCYELTVGFQMSPTKEL